MKPNKPVESLFPKVADALAGEVSSIPFSKSTLVHISHTLEDLVIQWHIPAIVFTGFQESSHWQQEAERYEELSRFATQTCIFAGEPLSREIQADRIHVTLEEDDPLRQEWFVLILSERIAVLLCGMDEALPASDEGSRMFDTLWTFDPAVIQTAVDVLQDVIARERPDRLQQLQQALERFPLSQPDPQLITALTVNVVAYEEQLNERLRWQNDLINTLFDMVDFHLAIFTLWSDDSFELRYASPRFHRLLGQPLPDSGNFSDVMTRYFHPEDVEHLVPQADAGPLTARLRLTCTSGDDYCWIESTVTVVTNADGETTTVYLVMRDVTDRHRLEQAEREQERLRAELEKEQELSATKTYFMNTVMHEFRTPLATILTSSDLLRRYNDRYSTVQREHHLQSIYNQVLQLREILDDIGMIINGDIDMMGFNPAPINVESYLHQLVETFRAGQGSQHNVTLDVPGERETVNLDAKLLSYILNNLLSNAAKFSEEKTRINVSLSHNNGMLSFKVQDEGIGIPHDEQTGIFEVFSRGSNVNSMAGGPGLGLKIAAECAAVHQGVIMVDSEPDEGTTFDLRLPYEPLAT